MLQYNKNLKGFSRRLRKGMTVTEQLLWSKLRRKQFKDLQFYRQKIIGNYIADFYCPKAKLVIELDGGQHYTIEGKKKDKKRDAYMRSIGLQVLRFCDSDVFNNMQGITEEIWDHL